MVRCAIYCRLSRSGGRSVERQEQDGRRIAAELGDADPAVFKETASASPYAKRARQEWNSLLNSIEEKQFDAIVLWMEDRSARDVLAAADFVKTCQDAGLTKLVLPSFEYDLSDQEDVAKFYGEVAAAQRELAKIVKRTRRAKLEQAEAGELNNGGKRAFGFTGSGTQQVPLGRALDEQALIREAVDRVLAGDSLRGIVGDWNRRGIRTALGEQWVNTSLRRMLCSPRIIGKRHHHGTVYTPSGWEPAAAIVDPSKWEACRQILTDPARRTTLAGRQPQHLLVGVSFCGACGRRLRARMVKQGGKRRTVYYCHDQNGTGGYHVTRDVARLEDLILDALFRAAETPKLAQVRQQQAAEVPDPTAELYESLARDQGRLDKLDDDQVLAALDDDHVKAAAVRRVRAEIEERMERTRAQARRLEGGRVAAHVPANLRKVWPDLSLDRQRAILAAVVERIEVYPQPPRGPGGFDPESVKAFWRA